jgi:hypothetical protein
MENDDTLRRAFELADERMSANIRAVDKKLTERLSQNEKAFLEIIRTVLSDQQASTRWDYETAKQVAFFYDQFEDVHTTLGKMIDNVIELSDLKPELLRIKKELEDQKPIVDNMRQSFKQMQKWLGDNV